MLTKVIIRQFAKIVQPKLSKYDSIYDLVDDSASTKNFINVINNKKLIQTKNLSPEQKLYARHAIPLSISSHIKNSKIQVLTFTPRQHKVHPITINMATGEINSEALIYEQVQNYYDAAKQDVKTHPCFNKEKFVIPQYSFDGKTLYMFNLPTNITQKDIRQALPALSIQAINFGYDIFETPAYAKLILKTENEMSKYMETKEQYYQIKDRICYIKSDQDSQRLKSQNRYLYIQGFQSQMSARNILLQLAKYGKLIHAEIPSILRKNITYKQALKIYENCHDSPVKINYHRKNGTIQSQYYPPYKPPELKMSKEEFSYDYADFQSKQEEFYKKKLKFCQNVDIYEDINEKISYVGKGYALVAYSCPQQAQNCYFLLKDFYKVGLIKQQYQFEFDKQYRKKVLRYIDNEYLQQRIKTKKSNEAQRQFDEQLQKKTFKQRMKIQLSLVSGRKLNEEDYAHSYLHVNYRILEDYKEYAKRNLGKQDGYGKSFDQLAQIQLYGRILPKEQNQFNLQVVQEIKPNYQMNFKDIDSRFIPTLANIAARDLRVARAKEKANKKDNDRSNREQQQRQGEGGEGEGEGKVQEQQTIDQFQGKKHFSTLRVQNNYRPYSPQQKAHRIMRFNQFISKTINEYLGIFSEESLERIFKSNNREYLNLHDVTFTNGQPFLTQYQLPKILDHHSDSEFAQIALEQFVKKNQLIKAKDINVQERILSNLQQNSKESRRYLTDTGIVDQIFEWQGEEGEDIDAYITQLNVVEAKFGQQYRKVTENDKSYVVKIKKVDHIYPLERMGNIEKFQSQMGQHIKQNPQQYKMVQQHIAKIMQTGEIPEEIRKYFGLQQSRIDIDSIMSQLGPELGIWKKDVIALNNCSNYSQQDIAADIQDQIDIEKIRVKKRPMKASDLAKDPDNVDVREQDGKFKVSKFRQI